jgi:MOSC domain-containing protein YiiM
MKLFGTVQKITRYPAKGHPGEILSEAELEAGLGMKGDFHARGGERQISLLSVEARQWMDAQKDPGLCFKRFKVNILFEMKGEGPEAFHEEKIAGDKTGSILTAGEAALELSTGGKYCFGGCPLLSAEEKCVLVEQSLFARVIKSGVLRPGDRLETSS